MPSSRRSRPRASPSAARPAPTIASAKRRWKTGNALATSKEFLDTELLRLVTAGSVDDGKSTLIGRLLFDSKQIMVDQLEHIEDASRRRGHDYVDLALLTDGLRAEREQGITIDVAYRSFVTPRRRFQLAELAGQLGAHDPKAIPMSALRGDNVVDGCAETMPWWDGPPLLEFLEEIQIATDRNLEDRRFPVQWVIRPMSDSHHDYRGYAGRVASGIWHAGDDVVVLPSGLRTRVEAVENADGPLDAAVPPMSITIRLADDVDVSR